MTKHTTRRWQWYELVRYVPEVQHGDKGAAMAHKYWTVDRIGGEQVTFADFVARHGLQMKVVERNRSMGASLRYYAYLDRVETKDGCVLRSEFGDGPTPELAVANYAALLRGKLLVHKAGYEDRREIQAPNEWLAESDEGPGAQTAQPSASAVWLLQVRSHVDGWVIAHHDRPTVPAHTAEPAKPTRGDERFVRYLPADDARSDLDLVAAKIRLAVGLLEKERVPAQAMGLLKEALEWNGR